MWQSDAADHTGAECCFTILIQEKNFFCDCMQKRSIYHFASEQEGPGLVPDQGLSVWSLYICMGRQWLMHLQ